MTDYKLEVAKIIEKVIENQNNEIKIDGLEDFIETPPNSDMGDYAFPCFRLAKSLKKAPRMIASDLKEDIDINLKDDKTTNIEKVEVAGRLLKLLYK